MFGFDVASEVKGDGKIKVVIASMAHSHANGWLREDYNEDLG